MSTHGVTLLDTGNALAYRLNVASALVTWREQQETASESVSP